MIFHRYKLTQDSVEKLSSLRFHTESESVGCADGFKIHPETGLIVTSCPLGFCIVDHGMREHEELHDGDLLAHVRLGDEPTRVSNVAFGKDHMFLTGEGMFGVWV